jgi:glycine oxidase
LSTGKVGIVGAGIAGSVLAFELLNRGWDVHLFEQRAEGDHHACSYAAAGMLSPYCELDSAEPLVFRLGVSSLTLWADLLGKLEQPVFLQRAGSLVVAHPYDESELRRLESRVTSASAASGMVTADRAEIDRLEPELESRFSHGLFFPNEGQIDNRDVMSALRKNLTKRGARLFFSEKIQRVSPHEIASTSGLGRFDVVVDCRGLDGRSDLADLRGVRGELIHLQAPEVHLNRPVRLMHPRFPLYVVPRPDARFIVGATAVESDRNDPVTVRSTLELLSAAYALHPAFAEATILETVSQVRPAFPDNSPRILHQKGLLRLNGLYRHGFLLSPALALAAIRFLEAGEIDKSSPELFREAA